ncbi:ABC transporter ATP-binding protein [Flavobacterium sp. HXWNR69]|uniref:ABC transporter ATP-binding protein n=1 Tax=Flavobacterium fragile TaxID=2949085 RepID=A0ABT0TFT8_9FLAO|nr:ABC transporter ATP-binding protein [Flavobacterium sp. HXWNR69]MCL9769727.1 ABC transporter ATP-binding protein [Flavobacterium sp. HXWNR69]
MSKVVIKAEHISKQYRLGLVGTGTVRDDLKRWWYNVRGKEDPFLKIGEANDRSRKGDSDYVWSLRDINFEINQGDSVGIIGRNGAGKSTLLKILSQVTQPTTGKIYTKGRIASLLEVGTGFHPEMTGRENIYLNGAILGMRKYEITRKLDEIIAFSGVERYIDTPVKRYSSGMYVRLAFAVAAHLESEILIVDEVLAVGDAEFQKKCLGKMNDVSKGEGRTVLFVSHNMAAVQSLCTKGILLNNGLIEKNGQIDSIVERYLSLKRDIVDYKIKNGNLDVEIVHNRIIDFDDDIRFEILLNSKIDFDVDLFLDFAILNQHEEFVVHYKMNYNSESIKVKKGLNTYKFSINKPRLKPGEYSFVLYLYDFLNNVYLWIENYSEIQISNMNQNLESKTNYKSHSISKVTLLK